ncbi:MAG: YceD family protein [Oxalobacter formigenes]|nr:YceD family protein [Oxalobacter formigenes]
MDTVLDDPAGFCREGRQLEGVAKIAELERLSTVCADVSGELRWRVAGGFHSSGYPLLELTVAGSVNLICQRCLEAFPLTLDARTAIVLAGNEEEADEVEDGLDPEDPTEVIVREKGMDVLVLVEDEVLLTLPLSPRHDVCPENTASFEEIRPESPFAILENLKAGNGKSN